MRLKIRKLVSGCTLFFVLFAGLTQFLSRSKFDGVTPVVVVRQAETSKGPVKVNDSKALTDNAVEPDEEAVTVRRSTLQRPLNATSPVDDGDVNERRLRHLAEVCERYRMTSPSVGNRTIVETSPGWIPGPVDDMLVDDKTRYLYCPVGKVATRSWKYVLLHVAGANISMGKADNRHVIAKYLPQLRQFNNDGGSERRLKTYYKFMVVREPMERFVSAYNYLFHESPFYQQSVGSQIVRRYRQNFTGMPWKEGRGVHLHEFVRFVIDDYNAGERLDRHWRPQHDLCHPCQVQYNYIGHYETLANDSVAILRSLGVLDRIQFPFRNRKRTTWKVLRSALKGVPSVLLRQLLRIYAPDYELFGFTMPTI